MRDFAPSPANSPAGRGFCFPSRTGLYLSSGLLFLFLFVSSFLSAQDMRPMDKRINFKVDSVSLHDALRMIRDLSDVHITYNVEEVKNQPKMTLNLVNVTVRSIFEKLLEHTNLQFVEASGVEVLIVPKKRKKDPVKGETWETMRGQVVDRKGFPLPNASIQVSTDNSGYTTDSKGYFDITAPSNAKLKVSYLGMKGVDEPIKIGVFVKIVLDTAPAVMNEYVVTGYQTVDKRMLASSTFTLTPDKILQAGVPSVDQMLQGKVPGLVVTNTSGSPSATPTIRIRGTSTFLGNASPLWVVDGIIKEDPVNLNPLQVNAALADAQTANFSIVGNAIAGVNPYDIESMTFLKDAAATAIYGVRAANGVIVITTKKGKAGQTVVNYNTNMGFTASPNYGHVDAMNSKDRINVSRELEANGIYYASAPLPDSYEGLLQQLYTRSITQNQFNQQVAQLETMNTDWFKILAHNQFNQNHSLGFSGGAGKTTYYTSFSFSDANGTFQGDNTKRYTAQVNLSTIVNSRMSIGLDVSGSYRTANGFFNGVNPLNYALHTSRAVSADSPYVIGFSSGNDPANATTKYTLHYSILNELAQTSNTSATQDISAVYTMNYRILPGLTYSGLFGADLSSNRLFSYATEQSYYVANIRGYDYNSVAPGSYSQKYSQLPFGGLAWPSTTSNSAYTIRNSLNFNHNFFAGRDQFSLMGTQEIHSVKTNGFASQELGYYPDRGDTYFSSFYNAGGGDLNAGAANGVSHYAINTNTTQNTLSWLAVASYRFKKRYILNANIRTDGSNRFGQYANQQFLPNWSIAGRWELGEEPWMAHIHALNGLSLRASYGTQGNVVTSVSPNLIAFYPQSPLSVYTNEYVLGLQSLPYPDLRWEKTTSYNVGMDLNLFDGRVALTVDGYYKKSSNLLISRNIPEEYGLATMYENYGGMHNSGWDAYLTLVPVRTRDFSWTQSLIYSMNFNSVVQSGISNLYTNYLAGNAIVPGKPLGAQWSYSFAGLDPTHGYPTYNNTGKYVGPNVDPGTFLAYSGRSTPLINPSTSTMLRYKALTLNANFNINLGVYKRLNPIYSSTLNMGVTPLANLPKELVDRWRKPGDEKTTNIPGFSNWQDLIGGNGIILPANQSGGSPYSAYDLSTARIINGSFLRCNNIAVSYAIPPAMLKGAGIHGASLTASVNNPFILDNKAFRGQDPETNLTGGTSLPIVTSWYLSMNINF